MGLRWTSHFYNKAGVGLDVRIEERNLDVQNWSSSEGLKASSSAWSSAVEAEAKTKIEAAVTIETTIVGGGLRKQEGPKEDLFRLARKEILGKLSL